MSESLQELRELFWNWTFLPLGLAVVLLVGVGSGLWRPRRLGLVWAAGLGLLCVSLYLGVMRHEWGEVLFNGQLL